MKVKQRIVLLSAAQLADAVALYVAEHRLAPNGMMFRCTFHWDERADDVFAECTEVEAEPKSDV